MNLNACLTALARARHAIVLLAALALCVPSARADWTVVEEYWYELSIGGSPCGFLHLTVGKEGDSLRTSTESALRLARDTTSVSIEMESHFIETERGEPVSVQVRQAMGGPRMVTDVTFSRKGDTWVAKVTDQAGTREVNLDGEWLPPQAVERFVNERIKAGATEIPYRTVDAQGVVRVMTVTMKRKGEGTATIPAGVRAGQEAREVPVTTWDVTNDLVPLASVETHSADGLLVDSVAQTGIGAIRTRLTSEANAKAALDGGKVEILVKSFVRSPTRIRGAREKDTLALRVTSVNGELPDLPSAGAQVVERQSPTECLVTVDVSRSGDATKEERDDRKYRDASALIDWESDDVKALMAKVGDRKKDETTLERADQLRRFVHNYVSEKNLGTAFASASETARTKAGDCSEHGVLLTALLRADGIPARLASGLVYADRFAGERDVWGWHVWTQACVDRPDGTYGWVDLDATLPTRFDAAHLLTGVSELAGGAADPMWASSLGLLGNLAIEVVERDAPARGAPTSSGGATTPASAPR